MARKLAKRFGLMRELEAADAPGNDSIDDLSQIQTEFNYQVAEALLAGRSVGQEALLAEFVAEDDEDDRASQADLDHARDRFIDEIGRLEEGADPTEQVERFIPALLPTLKLGLRLAGRKKGCQLSG